MNELVALRARFERVRLFTSFVNHCQLMDRLEYAIHSAETLIVFISCSETNVQMSHPLSRHVCSFERRPDVESC